MCIYTFFGTIGLFGQAFETIEIGGYYGNSTFQQTIYSERWKNPNTIGINTRIPFYLGAVGINISYFEYSKKVENASNAWARNIMFYWGVKPIKYKVISIASGLSTGMLSTQLTDNEYKNTGVERELTLGIHSEFRIELHPIIVFVEAQYQKVFNYYRQELVHVNFGIKVNMNVPKKMVEFIK